MTSGVNGVDAVELMPTGASKQEQPLQQTESGTVLAVKEAAPLPTPSAGVGEQNLVSPSEYLEFLRKLRQVWRDQPDLHIRYTNLRYSVRVPKTDTKVLNLATGLVAKLKTPFQGKKASRELVAMQPTQGVIRPGTMTLLLAPPGHGKTTFLKALSGRMSHDKSLTGDVYYNNKTVAENQAEGILVNRLCAYVGQQDNLFPTLTVHETFDFAAKNSLPDPTLLRQSPNLTDADQALVEEVIPLHERKADLLINMLGMNECRDTIVGNDLLRGISGGQKKRVSLGEMLLTNSRAYFLDEVSTGLDSSVTLHIFSALKEACALNNSSVVTALLQPTPETYALFDDVILMRDGYVVYHGPRADVAKWLWEVAGLEVPHGVDEAGFAVDYLSDPQGTYERARKEKMQADDRALLAEEQAQAEAEANGEVKPNTPSHVVFHEPLNNREDSTNHAPVDSPHAEERALMQESSSSPLANGRVHLAPIQPRNKQLRTAMSSSFVQTYHSTAAATPVEDSTELFERYQQTVWYKAMETEMALSKDKAMTMTPSQWGPYTHAQFGQSYPHSALKHTQLCMVRQAKLTIRNKTMVVPRLFQAILTGIIFGTLFIQLPISSFNDRMGLLLYLVMSGAFANLTELPVASEARNVVVKQIDAGFFPSFSFSLSVAVMHWPLVAIEVLVWGCLLYWIPGFTADAGRFFFFLFLLFINSNALSVFFRSISYTARNPDIARQMDLPFIICFVIFGGFLITYDKIPKWLIWLYYGTPFGWGTRSLALNEFKSADYDDMLTIDGTQVRRGNYYLEQFGFFTDDVWKWMGPVYLAGFYLLFLAVNAILLAYLKPVTPIGTRKTVEDNKKSKKTAGGDATQAIAGNVAGGVVSAPAPLSPLSEEDDDAEVYPAPSPVPAVGREVAISVGPKKSLRNAKSSFQLTALPFTPVTLAWRNIKYWVTVGSGKDKHDRQLLNDVSGFAAPGKMTALMGSSGAGKTTLMDVIAGRKTIGRIEGEILINGYPKEEESARKLCGYVEQNDIHIGTSTVRESLRFSAKLRLPTSVSQEAREQFVEEVMQLVGLSHIADRMLGDSALPGLSPGQMKLVTIAVELVANPSIIFLDEPTSGLDAPSAARVMRAVRRIAATGRTILCTIHQPAEELFLMFDRLLLLKSGGRDVYFGDIGRKGTTLVNYFEEASGHTEKLPKGYNEVLPDGSIKVHLRQSPANWMLDVIGASGQKADVADYAEIFRNSAMFKQAMDGTNAAATPPAGSTPFKLTDTYADGWTRYKEVQKRLFVSHWRNVPLNLTRNFLMIVLGVVLGVVYLDMSVNDFQGVTSKMSVIFLGLSFPSSVCAVSALPNFFRQRAVYYRETTIGLYGYKIFNATIFLTELPYIFIAVLMFLIPFYFMVGFEYTFVLFARFFLISFLMALTYSSLSTVWLGLLPNDIAANIANGLCMNLFFMFGGLFIKPNSIPVGWKWFYYIDPVPKAFIAVAMTQFECDESVVGDCPIIDDPFHEGQKISAYRFVGNMMEGDAGDYGNMVGWLILTIVVIRILSLLAMRFVSHIKR